MPWFEPAQATPGTVVACLLALSVSALGSAWAIGHGRRNALIDQPGERRSHGVPTPRGGGIGIVLACLLALAALQPAAWGWSAAGLALVAATGWWDDHRSLPAWPRLLVHVLAAACVALGLHGQGASPALACAGFALALGLVNAWNFMDGIDGLAASQALLCACAFALVLDGPWRVLALVLAAACLGFLPFNYPRASLFLGDVGSGALGFLLAVLVAQGGAARPAADWPLLLLPPTAMLADSGLTLLWRMRRGERWWQPHVQHAYQRWSRRLGHPRVTLAYAGWTFMAVASMLAALGRSPRLAWGVALAAWLAAAAAWRWLHLRYGKNKTEGLGT